MATKNKNIHTYDLDSVFSEYMDYLSDLYARNKDTLTLEVQNLQSEIEEDKKVLTANLESIAKIEALRKEIKKISILTEEKRTKLEEDLKKAEVSLQEIEDCLTKLTTTDVSILTEKQKEALDKRISSKNTAKDTKTSTIENYKAKIQADDEKKAELKAKQEELDKSIESITMKDEEVEETVETNPVEDFIISTQEFAEEIKTKEETLIQLNADLTKFSGKATPSLETFTSFLQANKLSTAHAEELFKYRHNPEMFEKIAYKDFKMRKMHVKRDFILKKIVVPAAVVSVGIGATVGAIAGSGLVGGSTVLGFIPVSGTPGLTTMATTITGGIAGLAATPLIIKGKNLITKTYYRLKAKSAVQNLEEYKNETSIENLPISKLIAKIQKTQHDIYNSNKAKGLILKILNRNRIHEVEAYTKELYKEYQKVEADKTLDPQVKAEALKRAYDLILYVEEFVANDVGEAKTHAMLTCKEDKKEHNHSYMIENIDIYANLKRCLDGKEKKNTKNLEQKKTDAYKLLCGEKLISDKLNFEEKYGEYFPQEQPIDETKKPNFTPKPEVKVYAVTSELDGTIYLDLEDGSEIKLPKDSGVNFDKEIATAKEGKNKYSITYSDGTKQEIMKKAKVLPEVETARNVLGALLHDEEYVKTLKQQGFKANTINSLKDKLTEWIKNPSQKLVMTGKVKELYNSVIEEINANAKNEMNLA